MMSSPSSDRIALAEELFRIGAVRFGKFTLASGKPSSYYLDLRILPSYPDAYAMEIGAYKSLVQEIGQDGFDVVAGVATAGVTVSSILSFQLKKPMVYVRREEKGYGLGRLVEGAVHPGWRALVVDDLVTTGGSIISAVEGLRKAGCTVDTAAVLVDRLEGGSENLAAVGVRLRKYADVKELASILYDRKKLTKRDYESVIKQIEGDKV